MNKKKLQKNNMKVSPEEKQKLKQANYERGKKTALLMVKNLKNHYEKWLKTI